MKKEFKLLISILKATPHLKSQIIFAIILLLLGITGELLACTDSTYMVFLTNSTLFFYQSIMKTSGSGLAQSSPLAKKLQTAYPFYIQISMYMITFLIISIHRLYIASKPLPGVPLEDSYAKHGTLILAFSVLCITILLFEAIMNKNLLLGITFMIIICSPILIFANMIDEFFKISMKSAIVIGFLIMIAGSILSLLVANLLYKYPIPAYILKEDDKV